MTHSATTILESKVSVNFGNEAKLHPLDELYEQMYLSDKIFRVVSYIPHFICPPAKHRCSVDIPFSESHGVLRF